MPTFDRAHPKIMKVTSSFLEFVSAGNKSTTHFILKSPDLTRHAHFWPIATQIFYSQFLLSMNLYQYAKIRLFHHLALEI